MDYEILYHELNRRRKTEIELHKKSMSIASTLYDKIIELYNKSKYCNDTIPEIRKLCSETCTSMETTYQALLNTDKIIEEIYISQDETNPNIPNTTTSNDVEETANNIIYINNFD